MTAAELIAEYEGWKARRAKTFSLEDTPLPDLERLVGAARHFVAAFDEFGADPAVMGFEAVCLEAALAGDPPPLDR